MRFAVASLLLIGALSGVMSEITMKVNPSVLAETATNVTVSWSGVTNPQVGDWIGLWSTDNSTYLMYMQAYVDMDSSSLRPTPHHGRRRLEPSLDHSEWEIVSFRSDYITGSGSLTITLYNMRFSSYNFWYYPKGSQHTDTPLALSPPVSFAKGLNEVTQRRLTLTTNPREMKVMWISGVPGAPSTVKFGASASALSHTATGSSVTYKRDDLCAPLAVADANWVDPGFIHSVVVDLEGAGLAPGSVVYYSAGSGSSFSEVSSFVAPAVPGDSDATFKFLMFADMGTEKEFCADCNVHDTQNFGPGSSALIERVAATELSSSSSPAALALHIGDLGYARGTEWKWDVFGQTIQAVSSRIPYLVGPGNHEYDHTTGGVGKDPSGVNSSAGYHPSWGNMGDDSDGECGVPFYHRFSAPATGNAAFWYSFPSNNVMFIVLSIEHSLESDSPQRMWLEETLASVNRTAYPWIVMNGHRPVFASQTSSGDNRVSTHLQELIGPLLQKYSVDLFLSGHFHSYERTHPVYNNTVMGSADSNPQATVHICIGTAGIAFGVKPFRPEPWSAHAQTNIYAYGRFSVQGSTEMLMELVDSNNGTILDTVTIRSKHSFPFP